MYYTQNMNCKIAFYLFVRRWGVYTFQNYRTNETDHHINLDDKWSYKNINIQRTQPTYNNLYKMN